MNDTVLGESSWKFLMNREKEALDIAERRRKILVHVEACARHRGYCDLCQLKFIYSKGGWHHASYCKIAKELGYANIYEVEEPWKDRRLSSSV